ncbi:uncharacterized protein FA14DRAFT_161517 [Meira miltonrushii]|uniref:SAC3/GANP/THP3 conserved domain-containing protein n=1 Tax=Meira miltonrushii TaxID=1280837 RepID=A0A316V9G0_9BASI|nr:uncharacterized protein FA14DRAFT_161517 [Meira miltonrushii]PWN33884.1 hypothetical protein FA14DRAFT_161517 [Meira miltonrushii]
MSASIGGSSSSLKSKSGSDLNGGSGSGASGTKTEWPQSLKNFANKCFKASNDVNRTAVQEELRALIYKCYTEGTINTIDWDHMQLKSLGNANLTGTAKGGVLGKQKKRPALSGSADILAEREKKEKRARRFDREREEFDRAEQEGLYAITPASNGSLADRLSGAFGSVNNSGPVAVKPLIHVNRQQNPSASAPVMPYGVSPSTGVSNYDYSGSWQNQSGQHSGGISAALFVGSDAADPNVIDWDQDTVVGLSTKLEKPYLRLTSAPDPRNVRTLATLMQTLELLKKKWRTEGNYNYICDQFKSMRQDLTVQRIKNEFTVKVYEIHARIALEKGDLGEYNQCQSQLRGLYALGIKGSVMEFLAYRILYLLHTRNRRDVNTLMAELTPKDKAEKAVKHALSIRSALATGNYHAFFRLYNDSPNMNAYILDHLIDRERINALLILARCFRPNLSLSFLTSELAFTDLHEADVFLEKHEVALYVLPASATTNESGKGSNKKGAKRNPPKPTLPPLEQRHWDAKAAQSILDQARHKFRTVDIKGQLS